MSWFTDLAGKAEALLNQVDQVASESLKDAGFNTPQKAAAVSEPLSYEPTVLTTSKPGQGAAIAQVLVGTTPRTSVAKKEQLNKPIQAATPRKFSASSSPTASDDKLFEFLNSPSQPKVSSQPRSPPTSITHTTKQAPPLASTTAKSVPRPQSASGDTNLTTTVTTTHTNTTTHTTNNDVQQEATYPPPAESQPIDASTTEADNPADGGGDTSPLTLAITDSPDGVPEGKHTLKQGVDSEALVTIDESISPDKKELDNLKLTISNYELENKLLKREINSLNEELAALMRKMSEREEKEAHFESEIHALREQASRTDHMIRQLRSHNEDLQASLEARDSQISILRARLSEADRKVEEQQRFLTAAGSEKER